MKIIHRDYKPPNIMVFKTDNYKYFGYQIQLIDFGFARTFQDSQNDKIIMGSPHYVAPESLMKSYSYSSDVWSIGIMLYYAIALEYPFEDSDTSELFRKIKEQPLTLEPKETWKDVSEDLKDLVKQMLEKDPEKRIKIEDIPIHPIFIEIHDIESKVTFTTTNRHRLTRYFTRLNPLERKFLKYSTKFIPPKAKTAYCEKFTLLDKNNFGYINFSPNAQDSYSKSIERSADESEGSEEDCRNISNNGGKSSKKVYKVTYSDYLAAILESEMLCGDLNIELLFHTLNPSYMTERIMKKEMYDALFFGNEDKEVVDLFNKLK